MKFLPFIESLTKAMSKVSRMTLDRRSRLKGECHDANIELNRICKIKDLVHVDNEVTIIRAALLRQNVKIISLKNNFKRKSIFINESFTKLSIINRNMRKDKR
jgi:hypothetical protein